MNFYVDSGGAILGVDPEKIYQGSANANTIRFVGAFASNVKVTVAFKLPTGVWTTPQLMTASTQLVGVVTSNGIQFNVWEYSIPALVTETFGTVNMQFYVYGDAGSGNGGLIATAASSFQVERGVPITLPDPTDDYETLLTQILSALSQIEGQIPGMEEDITGLQSKVSDISDKVSTLSDVTTELMSDVDNLSIQVSDLSEDKLDKQSGATAYEEAYVKDTDGSQKMERVTITSIASAIVKRDANGNINIAKGLSGNPKNGANMENIADVEEKISKCPTLDGNNDFTGENTFEEAIQAKKGTVVKNSLDETNYNAGYISRNDWTYLFPADSGTFALTKNIPTDYATQTALANTQRQVDGLYTLLEQKNEIYVQTATDTYTTRETAGGENIADGVQTPVKKITGKTVKTTNLLPFPYLDGTSLTSNGVTFTANNDGSITVNGTPTDYAAYRFISDFRGIGEFILSGIPSSANLTFTFTAYNSAGDSIGTVNGLAGQSIQFNTANYIGYDHALLQIRRSQNSEVINNVTVYPMLNEGSTALPYMPYFSGLKNAFFKEIVSTGRNLIPYPYYDTTKTENGVTFTLNDDYSVTANGTNTSNTNAEFIFVNNGDRCFFPKGTYTINTNFNGENSTLPCYVQRYKMDTSFDTTLVYPYSGSVTFENDTDGLLLVRIVIGAGKTVNNVTMKPMLNYGSSALPYEPYTQSVLSLPEAVELTEYDTAFPETGEIQKQSNTITFNGAENIQRTFKNYDYGSYPVLNFRPQITGFVPKSILETNLICNIFNAVGRGNLINEKVEGICDYTESTLSFSEFLFRINPTIYGCTMDSTDDELIAGFKAYLAAQSAAGNLLTVTYKTAEATTEQADFSADSYIAWKNGSETIEQGDTDNSEYGAENTVEQDYYLLTAPQEVTKE